MTSFHVLQQQVAGAAAAGGMSLERVREVAEAALRAMGTMGVALSGCTLPGAAPSDRRAAAGPHSYHIPQQRAGAGAAWAQSARRGSCDIKKVELRRAVSAAWPPPAAP